MLKVDTKQLLADSILELSKTRPLEKITVKDITDNCGAGRQTFYHHFHDKEELIGYVYTNETNKLLKLFEEDYSFEECIKFILDSCAEKRHFYLRAYKINGQNALMDVIFEHAVNYYTKIVEEKGGRESLDQSVKTAIRFNCYGALYCVEDWVKEGMPCSSEKMAEMIIENMPPKLKRHLQRF